MKETPIAPKVDAINPQAAQAVPGQAQESGYSEMPKIEKKKRIKYIFFGLFALLTTGFFLPEKMTMPVAGASNSDWNKQSFWYAPWGTSGTHKGIDIFGTKGTPVVAATTGLVIFTGEFSKGGNVALILGPKWRVHYYAHLKTVTRSLGWWASPGEQIGELGTTGNAIGKQPHLHYSILSLVPLPWLATMETHGWKRMFYLDPGAKLR